MNPAKTLGYEEYFANAYIDDNPFPDGSDECLDWLDGFLEAERDDMEWRHNGGQREG